MKKKTPERLYNDELFDNFFSQTPIKIPNNNVHPNPIEFLRMVFTDIVLEKRINPMRETNRLKPFVQKTIPLLSGT